MPSADTFSAQLDRLAEYEPGPFPVLSLYLNLQPDQHGRDNFDAFLRKELADRLRTYAAGSAEQQSLQADVAKIREYVSRVDPAANGLALFACGGADLFEAVPLAAPIDEHRLYIADEPHLYPLARLLDEYPRFAVLLANTHSARILVVAANRVQRTEAVEGTKTRHHKMGGWSQARYQRHLENYHLHHAKDVIEALGRIVAAETIPSIVIAGDEVIVPLLKEQLPAELEHRVVDVVKLDVRAPVQQVLETSMASLREWDAETDRQRVDAVVAAYRGNGLGVGGADRVREALEIGQVEELLIAASPSTIAPFNALTDAVDERSPEERTADELIAKARHTAARVRFIEDPALLAPVGGVAASLRFKL